MTLGQLLDSTKIYGMVAIYRDDAIEGAAEFCCDADRLRANAIGDSSDENLLECEVLSMFSDVWSEDEARLCIGLDWDGDEW